MRSRTLAVISLFLGCLSAAYAQSDPATAVAKAMITAMGGQDNWNKAHYIRYDFRVLAGDKVLVSRAHLWDKQTGKYRLEGTTKDGQSQVVLFSTANQQGTAYVNEKRIDGREAADAVKQAYASFINDMYWLAMPWKWLDAGVRLKYEGKKNANGKEYEIVQLTFDHVGLTPGDRYEAYVSPASHLMEHWEYTLQTGNKGSWDWEYTTTAGVKLAKNHTSKDGKSISMGDVRILDKVADEYFADPARTLSTLH